MRPRVFIPGWGGSGPEHWQTVWQAQQRGSRRVELPDWWSPEPETWIAAIDRTVREVVATLGQPPVLIAHSLACVAVAAWAARHRAPVAGALLVAPADPERADAAAVLRTFAPVPLGRLPFPSRVVVSDDDPYVSLERATVFATAWGAELELVPGARHINVASGHGAWPEGLALLRQVVARA